MEIIEIKNQKFLILKKTKKIQEELLEKIKINNFADIVFEKDDMFYYCSFIQDAKFEELIEEKINDIKESSEISLDKESVTSNTEHIS